jgi:predicted acylesterase/phospholipase RssA
MMNPTPTVPEIGNPVADRLADVVMKGGITSGVVYPWAVCELSRSYLFKSIGGTSAGAIAAVLTAAAEFRRRTDRSAEGFRGLEALPETLGAPGFMLSLFRPDPATRGLFQLFVKVIKARGTVSRLSAAVVAALAIRPWAILGAVPGLFVVAAALWYPAPLALRLGAVIAGLLMAAAVVLVILAVALRNELVKLDQNYFGLCRGTAAPKSKEPESLTNWLAAEIDRVAGKTNGPLTFRDLWTAPIPSQFKDILSEKDHSIELRTVTTSLTQGRPYTFPFARPDDKEYTESDQKRHGFYFDPVQFGDLFPPRVVQWMVDRANKSWAVIGPDRQQLLPLPAPEDIPVVLAARLSLSFPALISAVPLWGYDLALKAEEPENGGTPEKRPPFPCWFSDGGITSNFPIHFFDSVIPRWPTFGLNLRYFPSDPEIPCPADEAHRVWLPKRNSDGALESWSHLPSEAGVPRVAGFFGLIKSAMMSWNDNSFLRLPGYRDRIAEIWLKESEGGMNLEMDRTTVMKLAGWGREAGAELRRRFASPHDAKTNPMSWDNHRLRRAHGGLAAVRDLLKGMPTPVVKQVPGDTPLEEVLNHEADAKRGLTWARRIIPKMWPALIKICDLGTFLDQDNPFSAPPRPTVEYKPRAPR